MSVSFYKIHCLLLLLVLALGYQASEEKRELKSNPSTIDQRPNILLVIADDWSFPHAGMYGDKVVKTPHFDRIAREEGVIFTNAYCATPSCTPSRAALLNANFRTGWRKAPDGTLMQRQAPHNQLA